MKTDVKAALTEEEWEEWERRKENGADYCFVQIQRYPGCNGDPKAVENYHKTCDLNDIEPREDWEQSKWVHAISRAEHLADHINTVTMCDRGAAGLAAMLLHDQPFGFTWEDVDEIRKCADRMSSQWRNFRHTTRLRNLADRIAALLPPRESSTDGG